MFDSTTKFLAAIAMTGAFTIVGTSVVPVHAEVPAADEPQSPAEYEIITGEVGAVDFEAMIFTLKVGEEDPINVKITEETRYLYNGEVSDKETVLQAGTQVAVRHVKGTALAVSHRAEETPE